METIVYTAIINSKDILQQMPKEKGVRYICFSDKQFHHPLWEWHPVEKLGQADPRRIARRYKILSYIYFPGCRTIWIDGRINLNKKPSEMFSTYKSDFAVRPHHSRACIYQEGLQVKKLNYDDLRVVELQMMYLKEQGYPEMNGLHETGCLLRRPTKKVETFNSLWWGLLSTGSKRDQLSFDYVSWRLNHTIEEMNRGDVTVTRHARITNKNT